MTTLFSISTDTIMVVLLACFLLITATLLLIGAFNPLFLKMGLRNVPRRRAQTVLIVFGLMLSTLIITSALGTGDTIYYSLRTSFVSAFGRTDEVVTNQANVRLQGGPVSYVAASLADQIAHKMRGNANVAAVTGAIVETAAVVDRSSTQGKPQVALVGVPAAAPVFSALTMQDGQPISLADLTPSSIFLSNLAASQLNAKAGDSLEITLAGVPHAFHVQGIVRNEGLAAGGLPAYGQRGVALPEVLLPLARLQALLGQSGHINVVLIANTGDLITGAALTDAVATPLRQLLANQDNVALAAYLLHSPTGQQGLRQLLSGRRAIFNATITAQIRDLLATTGALRIPTITRATLTHPSQRAALVHSIMAIEGPHLSDLLTNFRIVEALSTIQPQVLRAELDAVLIGVTNYPLQTIKQDALSAADSAGSGLTLLFLVFGLFSIMAGIMLIFLIFVMLAAERRSEMGMARAIGTQRRHLVMQFLFEGYAYDMGAALVGVALGVGVGASLASVMNQIFGSFGLPLQSHIEVRSLVIAFCLGAILTFITVGVSAWRASRLNIVSAIRDIPEEVLVDSSLGAAWQSSLRAIRQIPRQARSMVFVGLIVLVSLAPRAHLAIAILPLVYLGSVWMGLLIRGPLLIVAGLGLIGASAINIPPNGTVFRLGGSLLIIGAAMLLRWILVASPLRAAARNRLGYTLAGLGIVAFYLIPVDMFHAAGKPDFDQSGPYLFFMSGIIIVLGGVWAVMFNVDILLTGVLRLVGRLGALTPVFRMAVSYPLQHKVRTGLTVAMFSLVIFLLMLVSVLVTSNNTTLQLSRDFGGFAIYGTVSSTAPLGDIAPTIAHNPPLHAMIVGTGGTAAIDVQYQQSNLLNQAYTPYLAQILSDDYLRAQTWSLHGRARGYASAASVWRALLTQPDVAIVDGGLLPSNLVPAAANSGALSGAYYQSATFTPIPLTVRDSRTGVLLHVRVIGFLDRNANTLNGGAIYLGQRTLIAAHDIAAPPTTYYMRVAQGQSVHAAALALGSTFLVDGLDVKETQVEYDNQQAFALNFFNLLEGFMGLGLVVGVAALGVIAFRSVVERRQQIGMLRAIGFQRWMVRAVFLVENSFVAILGTGLGLILGGLMGRQYVDNQAKSNPSVQFGIPWMQVSLVVGVAIVASLIATYLPARQAARVFPAEALRYE